MLANGHVAHKVVVNNVFVKQKNNHNNREPCKMKIMIVVMIKMAIILPTGQWYAPSVVINDAWYCMVLHGIAWYMVLHGIS